MDPNSQNYWRPEDQPEEAASSPVQAPATEEAQEAPQQILGEPEVEWHASEYIHHEKGMLWFAVLGLITILGAGLAAFLRQWIFAVLIVVMGVALGVFAKRPPREIHYQISREGVTIDERGFPFTQFKSFGVLNEGAFYSVQLRPAKRFMPGVSIYFAEPDGEKIFDALANHLPMEELNQDPVDRFMRWLRF